jgi:hypothetical protein
LRAQGALAGTGLPAWAPLPAASGTGGVDPLHPGALEASLLSIFVVRAVAPADAFVPTSLWH